MGSDRFMRIFHEAWGQDRGSSQDRPDGYNKAAWIYVQAKIEKYLRENPPKKQWRNRIKISGN